ncbi:hypothetical protein JCM8208_000013 [Rhodotorula glutinis]
MHSLESVREEDEGPSPSSSSSALHSAAQQRTHARQHSRIHERNLSAFFPRPGQAAQGYGDTFVDPHADPLAQPAVADIPAAASNGNGHADPFVVSPPKTRRGHHHRHSVSHNLFPFLDPAAAAAAHPPPPGTASSPSSARPHTNDDAQLPSLSSSASRTRFAHLPFPLRFLLFASTSLPLPTRLVLALALAQVALGATLWVQGQAGESLAVTGLGYLVVFDGVAALSSALLEREGALEMTLAALGGSGNKDLSIRRPYGPARLVTLSHFSQAVYLLFSAVYVCKESIEHVLLLHGPHDAEGAHGAGHGGVGHGEGLAVMGEGSGDSITLPIRALFLSAACAIALAVFARNHAGLSLALSRRSSTSSSSSSSSTKSAAAAQLAIMGPPAILTRLVNPFTATVVVFAVGLGGAAVVLPAAQLAPLDKVVALLESAAMFYVAQPAASATGHVLLQTSPGGSSAAVRAVEGLLEALPAVSSVDPPHIWQLSPSSSSSSSSTSPSPTLIATLTLYAHPHATDAERLGVTEHVLERVKRANERLRDWGQGEEEVEVCVQVKRG